MHAYESAFRPDFFPTLKERHRLSLPTSFVCPPSPVKRDRRATIPGILQSRPPPQQLLHTRKLSFPPSKIPALQIPIPRRSMHILPRPDPVDQMFIDSHNQVLSPISPTMAAASAAAANAVSATNNSATSVAPTNLSCAVTATMSNAPYRQDLLLPTRLDNIIETAVDPRQPHGTFDRVSFTVHAMNKSQIGLDQSMFLTKNAHIKRPRNAWIHFRCHYGQALKTEDPTLRAEEISKRASRRWARLTEKEKKPWHDLAEQEKQAHKEAFPEYRYCPKRANSSVLLNCPTPSSSSSSTSSRISPVLCLPRTHDISFPMVHQEGPTTGAGMHKKARRRTK
ncbi:hypothetical protein CLU79DRAFT_768471 [Phycomyces nitens]|nr:hypothetical protein CLU79DRAFT_768471 [Phycomyces nitens]